VSIFISFLLDKWLVPAVQARYFQIWVDSFRSFLLELAAEIRRRAAILFQVLATEMWYFYLCREIGEIITCGDFLGNTFSNEPHYNQIRRVQRVPSLHPGLPEGVYRDRVNDQQNRLCICRIQIRQPRLHCLRNLLLHLSRAWRYYGY
jgi:hypothetical protein